MDSTCGEVVGAEDYCQSCAFARVTLALYFILAARRNMPADLVLREPLYCIQRSSELLPNPAVLTPDLCFEAPSNAVASSASE
jgi:hypothetical protein